MRILLVDDEPDILEQAKIFLQKEVEGLSVENVASAEKALDLLEEDGFDAIVSDYQMPKIDGLEFLKIVRKEKNSEIPFIIFTGKGREDVAMDALNLGADRYLQKGGDPRSQYGVLARAIVQEVKHAKTKLEKAKVEAELSSLVKGSEDPIYIVDEDCRIVFANQAELEKTGTDFEEIIGTKFHLSHPEEDAEKFEEKVKKALRTGKPQRQEVKHENRGKYYDRALSPIKNPQTGKMDRIAVISKDLTDLKRKENDLRESERRYRGLFESINVGIVVHDPQGDIISANPAAEETFDLTVDQLKKKDLDFWRGKLFDEKGKPLVLQDFPVSKVFDSREPEEGIIGLSMSKDEDIKWYVHGAVPQFNEEGEIERVITSFKDITDRKRLEKDLRESEEKYRAITEKSHDAVFIIGEDNFLFINNSASELTGYGKKELYSMNWWDLLHPEDRERIKEIDRKGRKGEEVPTKYEARILTKEGEAKHGDFRVKPIEYEGKLAVLGTVRDITERKRTEEELRKSREEYKNLAENASDILMKINPKGEYIYISRDIESETGYSREEILGKNIRNFLTSDSYEEAKRRIRKRQEGVEKLPPFEVEIITKQGEKKPYELNTDPIFEDEQLQEIQIVARDISDKKAKEEKLRKSREEYKNLAKRFRSLFEASPDGVAFVDSEGIIREVNQAACESLECSKDDLVGLPLIEQPFYSGEERERFLERAKKTFEGEDVPPTTYELETMKGNKRYVEINNSIIKEDEEFKGLIIVARDLTGNKRLEEELEETKERYDALFERSLDAVYVHDFEGNFIDANPAALELLGYEKDEITSLCFENLLTEEQIPKAGKILEEVLETGRQEKLSDFKLKRKDGDTIWVETKASLLYKHGEPYAIQGIARDISERKETEEREEFLHSLLRHDVRNKAQIVQGYLELVRDFDLPEEAIEYLDNAVDATQEGIEIIEKVKTLRGVGKEDLREVNIDAILGSISVNKRSQASDKGIELEVEYPNCNALGGKLLEELFSNLIENSIQHAECEKIEITGRETEKECVIMVQDDGKGISDEDKRKIFERGYKSRETGGSGLGLHLVKKIAESYDGSVEVKDSELGGARFDVHLQKA